MGIGMSLWYNTGQHWKEVSMARNDAHMKGILVCSGPSLNKIDISTLTGMGKRVFALSGTYPEVKPDVCIGMDLPIFYDGRLFDEPFIKILRGGHKDKTREGRVINTSVNLYYADVEELEDYNELFLRRNHDIQFVWHNNTLSTALHLMVWMGHREIYIAGCDLDNSKQHYFNDITLEDRCKKRNQRLHEQLFKYLEWFVPTAAINGIQVYSISPHSRINTLMNYVDLKDLNDEIRSVQQERDYLPHCWTYDYATDGLPVEKE